jgi:hypothetical protein
MNKLIHKSSNFSKSGVPKPERFHPSALSNPSVLHPALVPLTMSSWVDEPNRQLARSEPCVVNKCYNGTDDGWFGGRPGDSYGVAFSDDGTVNSIH